MMPIIHFKKRSTKKRKQTSSNLSKTIILLMGPPGSGKGTCAPYLCSQLHIPHLSTGDMLREAVASGSTLGKQIDTIMKAGKLVSNKVVLNAIEQRIQHHDCRNGFLLDGYPRNVVQAKQLNHLLKKNHTCVTKVIALDVNESVLEERIVGRWVHPQSGRSYHVRFRPPHSLISQKTGRMLKITTKTMRDDITKERLVQRKDDTKEAFQKRMVLYNKETVPVLAMYKPKQITYINASVSHDNIRSQLKDMIHQLQQLGQ